MPPKIFQPLFYGDQLITINPSGCLGIVTLWTPPEFILRCLTAAGVDLSPATSKISVLGWLRGRGFRHLLRNLLYNPQIEALVLFGKDMGSGSEQYLERFFQDGLEDVETLIEYEPLNDGTALPRPVRLKGTRLIMDNLVTPDLFVRKPHLFRVHGLDEAAGRRAAAVIESFHPQGSDPDRLQVPVPRTKLTTMPGNVRGHSIVSSSPLVAWSLLVHRAMRFGRNVKLERKTRRELQNVKVVVENPVFDAEAISRSGFDPQSFRDYQADILSPESGEFDYNYGARIRGYFGLDCLDKVVDNLASLPDGLDNRRSYITLWDNQVDGQPRGHGPKTSIPCLVSLFFRLQDRKVYLTATFRTHNIADAWLKNFFGLMALQEYVVQKVNDRWLRGKSEAAHPDLPPLTPGSITVFSHSISLDPDSLEEMKLVAEAVEAKGPRVDSDLDFEDQDPHGYLHIRVEDREIVVSHLYKGHELAEYRGRDPKALRRALAKDLVVSDIDHAMYVGMEIQKAWERLKKGELYHQDE